MATSQSETPADIFQENYGEICPLIGKRKNFSNVTNNLFAKKLITKEELNQIESQPNLNDEERGRRVADLLLDKIDEDEGQAAQCLLGICDVFESKLVNNEPLRKIGASMRGKLSNTVSTVQSICSPNATIPAQSESTLTIEDAKKVYEVLEKAIFNPTKWEDLGLNLGLLMPRLDAIGESGDAYKHLKKTIKAWLEGADKAKSTTWQTLIDAVTEADNAAGKRIPGILKSMS